MSEKHLHNKGKRKNIIFFSFFKINLFVRVQVFYSILFTGFLPSPEEFEEIRNETKGIGNNSLIFIWPYVQNTFLFFIL